MKKLTYILIFFTINISLLAQNGLINNSTGKINNQGKILIKKNSLTNKTGGEIENSDKARIEISKPAYMDSQGFIINNGVIEAFGPITGLNQASIDGTVIIDSDESELRYLPQINYLNFHLRGKGDKNLSVENQPLITRNYFYTTEGTPVKWDKDLQGIEIHSLNETEHFGTINPAGNHGKFKLVGDAAQDISGSGRFVELELDNSDGADVVNKTGETPDGFRVAGKLLLTNGVLRNTDDANFRMGDASSIVRNFGSSLAEEPIFEGGVDVQYIGSGQMTTGGEIPTTINALKELMVENEGGIILSKDATVNERIYAGDNIRAYEVDGSDQITLEHTLTYTGENDPEFDGDTEIEGKFKRTNLNYDGSKNLFNNRKTYASFTDPNNPDGVANLTFDVKAGRSWSVNPRQGDEKIQRTYAFFAENESGDDLANAEALNIGYAWKHDADNPDDEELNETPADLLNKIEQLMLQRWNPTIAGWENNNTSTIPQEEEAWLTAEAVLKKFGDHAVGLSASDYLYLLAKVLMEGPFRNNEMSTDLADKDLIPKTPPDIYPYNLDPNKDLHEVEDLPDNVVDWIVVEFRDKPINPDQRHFRTAFLTNEGTIVDSDGSSPVRLSRISTNNLDTTGAFYWIAIRHRSHLTIMSKDSLYIGPDDNPAEYDFSNPVLLYGGSAKPVAFDENNRVRYGMIAGNYVNNSLTIKELLDGAEGMDVINNDDYRQAWNSFNLIDMYLDMDFNMDGIITTKDFNKSWNNRDQISPVK